MSKDLVDPGPGPSSGQALGAGSPGVWGVCGQVPFTFWASPLSHVMRLKPMVFEILFSPLCLAGAQEEEKGSIEELLRLEAAAAG